MFQRASWVANAVGGQLIGEDVVISGSVETDSRLVSAGSLYVARVGENADGHRFIADARQSGAVCAIVETPQDSPMCQVVVADATLALGKLAQAHLAYLRSKSDIEVAGITGSAGKTTTKDLLLQILSSVAPTVAPQLSYNNEVGCPLTILRADLQTRYLVLEMGASGMGHLRYLTDIAPLDVAVVLMVGSAHLDGFGSVDNLQAAKQELIEGLRPGGIAVLNADDPRVWAMKQAAPGEVMAFSATGKDSVTASAGDTSLDESGHPHFTLHHRGKSKRVALTLVGTHQVSNALAATTAALGLGIPLENILSVLVGASALSPHRMNVRAINYGSPARSLTVIDDSYNANLDSMKAALRTSRQIAGDSRRLVAVLGSMLELGEASEEIHQQVADEALAVNTGVFVAVGEEAKVIYHQVKDHAEAYHLASADEALRLLPDIIEVDDVLLIKGSFGSQVWQVAETLLIDADEPDIQIENTTVQAGGAK